MHHPRLITLLTDFGLTDPFVGIMKGVIARVDPRLRLIDLTHGIPAQDVRRGAMALAEAVGFFPKGTVHLAVVDPGVGSERRPVAIRIPGGFLVGPDNGLFSFVLARFPALEALVLDQPRYWHSPQPSKTFHGRDLFAPIAAHLARGTRFAKLGTPIDPSGLHRLPLPEIRQSDGRFFGEITAVDHFGNLVTNLPAALVAGGPWLVTVAGSEIAGVGTYAEVSTGALAALIGSHGQIEIAVNQGRAVDRLAVKPGEPVSVRVEARQASTCRS